MNYQDALRHFGVTEPAVSKEVHREFVNRCEQHFSGLLADSQIQRERQIDPLVKCLDARDVLLGVINGTILPSNDDPDDQPVYLGQRISVTRWFSGTDESDRLVENRALANVLVTTKKIAVVHTQGKTRIDTVPLDKLTACIIGPGVDSDFQITKPLKSGSLALVFSNDYENHGNSTLQLDFFDSETAGLVRSAITSQLVAWKRDDSWSRTDVVQATELPINNTPIIFLIVLAIIAAVVFMLFV